MKKMYWMIVGSVMVVLSIGLLVVGCNDSANTPSQPGSAADMMNPVRPTPTPVSGEAGTVSANSCSAAGQTCGGDYTCCEGLTCSESGFCEVGGSGPEPTEVILWTIGQGNGNLTAIAGANRAAWNAYCEANASGNAATKSQHAMFVATTGTGLLDLGIPADGQLVSNDGTVIATSLTEACSGVLSSNLLQTSLVDAGVLPGFSYWWSGATPICQPHPLNGCYNWTSTLSTGMRGDAGRLTTAWVNWDFQTCDTNSSYYLCASW
jgi:hypothetical protein